MEPILQLCNITKHYTGFQLEQVSLTVPSGCIVGLIGENGAGKSTLFRIALGLAQPESGSILFQGKPFAATPAQNADIGVVFGDISFCGSLTPLHVEKICQTAYPRWDHAQYHRLLELLQVPEKKPIQELSKGTKMKLNLAIALSHRPKLLLLDEATSGLDPIVRETILDLFLEFVQEEDHSILISSHISSDLERIADYLVFLHEGKVFFSLPKDTLHDAYGILRCRTEQFEAIPKAEMLAYRKEACQWDVLVADKKQARLRYPHIPVDDATIDEVLAIYVKGVRTV